MKHPQDVLSRWFFLRIVKYDFEGQILKLMILQTIQSSPAISNQWDLLGLQFT